MARQQKVEIEKHYAAMLQGLEKSCFIQSDKSAQMLIEKAWITALMLTETSEPLLENSHRTKL